MDLARWVGARDIRHVPLASLTYIIRNMPASALQNAEKDENTSPWPWAVALTGTRLQAEVPYAPSVLFSTSYRAVKVVVLGHYTSQPAALNGTSSRKASIAAQTSARSLGKMRKGCRLVKK